MADVIFPIGTIDSFLLEAIEAKLKFKFIEIIPDLIINDIHELWITNDPEHNKAILNSVINSSSEKFHFIVEKIDLTVKEDKKTIANKPNIITIDSTGTKVIDTIRDKEIGKIVDGVLHNKMLALIYQINEIVSGKPCWKIYIYTGFDDSLRNCHTKNKYHKKLADFFSQETSQNKLASL